MSARLRRGVCFSVGLMFFLSLSGAFASTSRLKALGNETRIFLDDSNLFLYPGSLPDFQEVIAEPFDNWAGVIIRVNRSNVLGFMLDRPVPSATQLNAFLDKTDSRRLRGLNVKPWFDLMYGLKVGKALGLGIHTMFSYDTRGDGVSAKASDLNIRIGAGIGLPRAGRLDLALGLNQQDFEDTTPGQFLDNSGGRWVEVESRIFFPISDSIYVIPIGRVRTGGIDVAPDETEVFDLDGGLGMNVHLSVQSRLFCGLLFGARRETQSPARGPSTTDRVFLIPKLVTAAESRVRGLVFRVGFQRSAMVFKDERVRIGEEELIEEITTFQTDFQLELGLGVRLGRVLLDGVMEKDLFRDGPHFIGGGRHGGGFFSNATITYQF